MNESQLRSANNDGMDSQWKPEPQKEIALVSTLKNVFNQLSEISSRFDKYTEEDLDKLIKEDMVFQITVSIERIREIRAAIKAAQ